jgi:hypothetical protein
LSYTPTKRASDLQRKTVKEAQTALKTRTATSIVTLHAKTNPSSVGSTRDTGPQYTKRLVHAGTDLVENEGSGEEVIGSLE